MALVLKPYTTHFITHTWIAVQREEEYKWAPTLALMFVKPNALDVMSVNRSAVYNPLICENTEQMRLTWRHCPAPAMAN